MTVSRVPDRARFSYLRKLDHTKALTGCMPHRINQRTMTVVRYALLRRRLYERSAWLHVADITDQQLIDAIDLVLLDGSDDGVELLLANWEGT